MTKEKMINYGLKIRAMRLAAGLTQTELGTACGYPASSARTIVQHWEHGRQMPGIDSLRTIAVVLQVPLNQVVP